MKDGEHILEYCSAYITPDGLVHYGVKGMEWGKHKMARNKEYIERLKKRNASLLARQEDWQRLSTMGAVSNLKDRNYANRAEVKGMINGSDKDRLLNSLGNYQLRSDPNRHKMNTASLNATSSVLEMRKDINVNSLRSKQNPKYKAAVDAIAERLDRNTSRKINSLEKLTNMRIGVENYFNDNISALDKMAKKDSTYFGKALKKGLKSAYVAAGKAVTSVMLKNENRILNSVYKEIDAVGEVYDKFKSEPKLTNKINSSLGANILVAASLVTKPKKHKRNYHPGKTFMNSGHWKRK